jgi:hypothetical protein
MIPSFNDYINESISDDIWKALDKLALYLHKNPDIKDAISKSMAEVGDDTMDSFLDGLKGDSYGSSTIRKRDSRKDSRRFKDLDSSSRRMSIEK